MIKKRNPQDANVHKLKTSMDVLRKQIARLTRVIRGTHPSAWRASK